VAALRTFVVEPYNIVLRVANHEGEHGRICRVGIDDAAEPESGAGPHSADFRGIEEKSGIAFRRVSQVDQYSIGGLLRNHGSADDKPSNTVSGAAVVAVPDFLMYSMASG
jgi:hypothetical protein